MSQGLVPPGKRSSTQTNPPRSTGCNARAYRLVSGKGAPGRPDPCARVMPFAIPDGFPTETEISEAVIRLRKGKAPGPTGLRSDHIKDWYAVAKRKKQPDTSKWDAFVRLLQHVYTTGEIPAQCFLRRGVSLGI
jgi:hypothetical protein